MQPLNLTHLTPEQLEKLSHKLPNFTMLGYDSFKEHIQLIDAYYPYSMSIWLIILITVLGTLIHTIGSGIYYYRKYKLPLNKSRVFSAD